MPIYEFNCGNCKKDHEMLVRSHDWSGIPCPACGASQLQKKFSVFAAASSESEAAPPCSGTPSACGRCSMDD